MLYEYISVIFGILKIILYKAIYFKRIIFCSIPRMNHSFKLAIQKKSKLIIGKKIRTRNNVSIRIYNSGNVKIGNECFFNDGCSINCQDKISIGNNVICGQNVMFFDHDHDYKKNMKDFIKSEIVVGNNVWIGANCIILKGVRIGDNTVIAAGTIVRNDVASNTLTYEQKKIKSIT